MFDVAVIGGGIMGAPAARFLAEAGMRVAVVASPEPDDPAVHDGPFGAHYDVSRLTWLSHSDPVETDLSVRSQAAMAALDGPESDILTPRVRCSCPRPDAMKVASMLHSWQAMKSSTPLSCAKCTRF